MSNFTEDFICADGTAYEIKTRLDWFESQRIDQTGESILLEMDGETFGGIDDARRAIEEKQVSGDTPGVLRFELRIDHAQKNLARLKARLVGLNARQILGISAANAAQLLRRIEEIEEDEKAQVREILDANPTTTRSLTL